METWVFGYGSLIWNPGFRYSRKIHVTLADWQLRFWQSSQDHRGTPQFPGRVATIVPARGAMVWGTAYCIEGPRESVLAYLDHREKGGYQRRTFSLDSETDGRVEALCYVGSQDLSSYVGPEPEEETAAIIGRAVGPSGRNIDYLRNVYKSLMGFGRMEPHVERLIDLVDCGLPQA